MDFNVTNESCFFQIKPLALSLAVLLGIPVFAAANPVDDNVVAGNAQINSSDKNVIIEQTSDKAIIDWKSFSIA